ncbi:UDP-N-acetylmuramoyl-tripeptide--D-alanyl-D-alanine ligase [Marchantia polymorpha subsp. ruderalis]|uniref:UDP-MurNAc-pentapeptide synthetase n=2 Tax=Marchantia polymorpha TaxID=3197 RepID=A0A176W276_MARPO|nr:hypothetical protein AXG93_3040s1240 [Marchantia polymorpha subsp. ruderalis]PTQ50555.1 hypothetical protein MARPO_0001s0484 [Marchantia polymorpha]BBM99473.1 hypothetical protein Mp_1g21490 [Marchantia polymorpha subsp. ruderalis]|eukprot:PTQ50555.1 hypothetical protein MARPO_0001s0484 [Marchantia polymorpha]
MRVAADEMSGLLPLTTSPHSSRRCSDVSSGPRSLLLCSARVRAGLQIHRRARFYRSFTCRVNSSDPLSEGAGGGSQDYGWSCDDGGVVWDASRLARAVGGDVVQWGSPGSICTDSRKINRGQWFLALVGPKFDGHDFLQQALDRGCAGVIGQNVSSDWPRGFIRIECSLDALHLLATYVRRLYRGPVVGITGSTGKTTARAMTSLALKSLGHVHQTEGNFNNHIGVPLTLLKLPFRNSACILEMGMSAAGEMEVLARIAEPSVRVLLNVGPAHMENFEKLEHVAAAKGELFSCARPGDVCILNADDPLIMGLILPPAVQVIFFGRRAGCHVKLVEAAVTEGGRGVHVILEQSSYGSITVENFNSGSQILENLLTEKPIHTHPQKPFDGAAVGRDYHSRTVFDISSPGLHLAMNACAAAAVAVALRIPVEKVCKTLSEYSPVGRRSRLEQVGNVHILDDAYNSNPMSLESSLRSLSYMDSKNRRVAFLGDMLELGRVSEDAHQTALALCTELQLDYVGLVGQCFAKAAMSLGMTTNNFNSFEDSEQLAKQVDFILEPGDTVLVKGSRGMKMEAVVDAIRRMTIT